VELSSSAVNHLEPTGAQRATVGFEEMGKGAMDESSTFMPSINTSTDNADKISERELSKNTTD
jgi:hypothetical protein